jgi:hypothetical protein
MSDAGGRGKRSAPVLVCQRDMKILVTLDHREKQRSGPAAVYGARGIEGAHILDWARATRLDRFHDHTRRNSDVQDA